MNLSGLAKRAPVKPGEARLPWDEPAFAQRMLAEHLADHHDMASRRGSVIDGHVAWLSSLIPDGHRVLDLGCGPGLYLERFARAGWQGIGVDVSPAAIDYATAQASATGSGCSYALDDLRTVKLDGRFDLVLCVFGELSTFPLDVVRDVLVGASHHLSSRGRVVIEMSTRPGVEGKANRPVSWYSASGGLFGDGAHVVLRESGWFESDLAAVERWWVIDELTPQPRMFGSTTWYHDQLATAIADADLVIEGRFGDLAGTSGTKSDFETFVLRRS